MSFRQLSQLSLSLMPRWSCDLYPPCTPPPWTPSRQRDTLRFWILAELLRSSGGWVSPQVMSNVTSLYFPSSLSHKSLLIRNYDLTKQTPNFIHFSTLKFDMFFPSFAFECRFCAVDSASSRTVLAWCLLGRSGCDLQIQQDQLGRHGRCRFQAWFEIQHGTTLLWEQHVNMSCFLLHLHTSSILSVIPRAKFENPPAAHLEASSSSRCVHAPRRSTCHAADEEVLLAQPGPKAQQRQLNNHGCLNQRW